MKKYVMEKLSFYVRTGEKPCFGTNSYVSVRLIGSNGNWPIDSNPGFLLDNPNLDDFDSERPNSYFNVPKSFETDIDKIGSINGIIVELTPKAGNINYAWKMERITFKDGKGFFYTWYYTRCIGKNNLKVTFGLADDHTSP